MTREEFYAEYGKVEVTFSSYYKYTFTYKAELPDGSILTCQDGGNSADIYRCEVAVGTTDTVEYLQPYAGSVYKDGKEICSFYDY